MTRVRFREQEWVHFLERRGPVMRSVERLRIYSVQLAHTFGEIRLRRLDEQVVMVRHETVRVYRPVKPLPDFGKNFQEPASVSVRQVNVLATISP